MNNIKFNDLKFNDLKKKLLVCLLFLLILSL